MWSSAPRVCSEPGGQKSVLSLSLDCIIYVISCNIGLHYNGTQLYYCRLEVSVLMRSHLHEIWAPQTRFMHPDPSTDPLPSALIQVASDSNHMFSLIITRLAFVDKIKGCGQNCWEVVNETETFPGLLHCLDHQVVANGIWNPIIQF